MNKEFIPYESALALKELGFELPILETLGWYDNGTFLEFKMTTSIPAPLYQQAFRWFREKYGLYFSIQYFLYDKWCLQITERKENTVFNNKSIDGFNTYKEAEQACLEKLIEIVKTNN